MAGGRQPLSAPMIQSGVWVRSSQASVISPRMSLKDLFSAADSLGGVIAELAGFLDDAVGELVADNVGGVVIVGFEPRRGNANDDRAAAAAGVPAEGRVVDDHHIAVLVVVALALEHEVEEVVGDAQRPERGDQPTVLVRPVVVAVEYELGGATGEIEGLLRQPVAMAVIDQDEPLAKAWNCGARGIEGLVATERRGGIGGIAVGQKCDFLDDGAGGGIDVKAARAGKRLHIGIEAPSQHTLLLRPHRREQQRAPRHIVRGRTLQRLGKALAVVVRLSIHVSTRDVPGARFVDRGLEHVGREVQGQLTVRRQRPFALGTHQELSPLDFDAAVELLVAHLCHAQVVGFLRDGAHLGAIRQLQRCRVVRQEAAGIDIGFGTKGDPARRGDGRCDLRQAVRPGHLGLERTPEHPRCGDHDAGAYRRADRWRLPSGAGKHVPPPSSRCQPAFPAHVSSDSVISLLETRKQAGSWPSQSWVSRVRGCQGGSAGLLVHRLNGRRLSQLLGRLPFRSSLLSLNVPGTSGARSAQSPVPPNRQIRFSAKK